MSFWIQWLLIVIGTHTCLHLKMKFAKIIRECKYDSDSQFQNIANIILHFCDEDSLNYMILIFIMTQKFFFSPSQYGERISLWL